MNTFRNRARWLIVPLLVVVLLLVVAALPGSTAYWVSAMPRVVSIQLDRLTAPAASPASLGPFPGQGDDSAPSLGTFDIFIAPPFQPLMAGYPGYNAVSKKLTSPLMHDPTTIVGRSAPHLHGSPPDVNGTPVGTAGVLVADSDFLVEPAGFQGPADTREIHTRIADFNLSAFGGLVAVRAGASAPGRPMSPGEVQSQSGASGDPSLDFPAESFFDVFVEVDLPPLGLFPGGTLFNQQPLLVFNPDLAGFPPHVVYIHGETPAVPVLFLADDPGGAWLAGDLFGWLSLAGHGMDFTDNQGDEDEFLGIMRFAPSMLMACETFNPQDHNGDALVDLFDIILMATRWPIDADILGVQQTAGAFGQGCLIDPPPPLLIPAGSDVFHTPPGQSMIPLDLPPGFFGPGSDPFIGVPVPLAGVPLFPQSSEPFQPFGPFPQVGPQMVHVVVDARQAGTVQGDTVVTRDQDALLDLPGFPAAEQTIPIEIVELSLQSAQPIVVTYNGGQNPEQWSLIVDLNPNANQPTGALTLTRTGGNNGVFTMDVPVAAQLLFNRIEGPPLQAGPVQYTQHFYSGFGTGSPLGPSYDTGPPVPWAVP